MLRHCGVETYRFSWRFTRLSANDETPNGALSYRKFNRYMMPPRGDGIRWKGRGMPFGGDASDAGDRARILGEVDLISATPEFERAPVMRRLLLFLVRTTLAGGGDELKAYGVAVDGLGRDPDFDSQSDSYPRVQVGRLRKMIDAYYTQNPPVDDVRLRIRTGGYRVHFTAEDVAAEPADPILEAPRAFEGPPPLAMRSPPLPMGAAPDWLMALTPQRAIFASVGLILFLGAIVLALSPSYRAAFFAEPQAAVAQAPLLELGAIDVSGDPGAAVQARRIQALLGDALHRSWTVRVRAAGPLPAGAPAPAPDYRLTGQIVPGAGAADHRLYLDLRDAQSGVQIWSEHLLLPGAEAPLLVPMRPIVSTLIRPAGVIATHERTRAGQGPGYPCLLRFDAYFRDRDPPARAGVTDCIERTIALDPANAAALAASSFLALDPSSGGGTPGAEARAADFARRAVTADPYSAEAHVAEARVALIAGQCRRGTRSADRALALNSYSPELTGILGVLLTECDDPRAETLLRNAQALDPDSPTFYGVALTMLLLERGDLPEAMALAEGLRPPGRGMAGSYALIQTLLRAGRGDAAGAKAQWRTVAAVSGAGERATPERILRTYVFVPRLRERILTWLAGHGVIARG